MIRKQERVVFTFHTTTDAMAAESLCKTLGGRMIPVPGEITADYISSRLDTAGIPDPDLIIRPGAEHRLSNYLLWQAAYAELYFSDTLWPDFDVRALHEAIAAYQKRDRRFGGVKTGAKGDKKA